MKRRWPIMVMAAALILGACGGGDDAGAASPVVQEAIDGMVSEGIPRDTAECFVGGLVDEFGLDGLAAMGETEEVSPEVALKTLALFGECDFDLGGIDDGGFGAGPDISDFREMASPRSEVEGPYTYGDDDFLDALWDDCEDGSGEACDELFFDSPVGSEYEAFGNTCGNRMELSFYCNTLDE